MMNVTLTRVSAVDSLSRRRRGAAVSELDSAEIEALAEIDWTGLELAAPSYTHKRMAKGRGDRGWSAKLRALVRACGLRR